MAANSTIIPLIRTKLHRPPVPFDYVQRTRLLERLNERLYRPLTLVSTPAGYGKSTTNSRQQAADLLSRLNDFYGSIHNTWGLFNGLALQALLHAAAGEQAKALTALNEAVTLARPGKFIRPFLDLGPSMFDLLTLLSRSDMATNYVGKLLSAFRKEGADRIDSAAAASRQTKSPALDENLTKREREILVLLTRGLPNKRIAEELFISPETVRRHNSNIYSKLNVHDRHASVQRALAIGLIHRS